MSSERCQLSDIHHDASDDDDGDDQMVICDNQSSSGKLTSFICNSITVTFCYCLVL